MRKKKSAKEVVTEVIAKVEEELATPTVVEVVAPVEDKTHYYLCNITLGNNKPCNCNAFI